MLQNAYDSQERTGISKESFQDLLENIHLSARNSLSECDCLGLFLMHLKTGLSQRILATLFGVKQSTVSCTINAVKSHLVVNFVPSNLGFEHISREGVIKDETTDLAKHLFSPDDDDCAILVLDGTYVYIQKSSQHTFQCRTFSMHKHRPLVKPMMVVSTTGYVVSVVGPYLADGHNHDAAITQHMMKHDEEGIMDWLRQQDIFILDVDSETANNFSMTVA